MMTVSSILMDIGRYLKPAIPDGGHCMKDLYPRYLFTSLQGARLVQCLQPLLHGKVWL
jgi:hypothetical protein